MNAVESKKGVRKRTYSDSSDGSSTEHVVENKKSNLIRNGICNGAEGRLFSSSSAPLFRENSINEILKVVSLQSFSNPRLHMLPGQEHVCSKICSEEHGGSGGSDGGTTPNSGRNSPLNGVTSGCLPVRPRGRRGSEKNIIAANTGVEKDDRYWEKRERNNASAKRSRDARRVRELETQIRAEFLEDENNRCKVENQMLREENSRLLKIVEESKLVG